MKDMTLHLLRIVSAVGLILIINSCSADNHEENEVLVCLSEDAYAYHDHECMGFNQCDGGSDWVSMEEAQEMHRTPCGYCY